MVTPSCCRSTRPRSRSWRKAIHQELTLLYDVECNICIWLVAKILRRDEAHRLRPLPIQSEEGRRLLADLDEPARLKSWHAIAADGRRWSAGDAFAPILGAVPRLAPLGRLASRLPSRVRHTGYRLVAEHRVGFSKFVPMQAKRRARAYVDVRRAATS